MNRSISHLLFAVLALLMLNLPGIASADTAAVAGSIYPCMTELAEIYAESGGTAPELVMGSSGKLAAQIKGGAPFGLYLSASRKWALHLKELDLLEEIHPMATSPIVLWWMKDEAPALKMLSDGKTRVSIADPQAAPFGRAARDYLQAEKLYDKLLAEKHLVIGGTVQQAGLATRNGGADVAIVSLSIAKKMNAGSATVLPVTPLANAGALVKGKATPDLRNFWAFVRSAKAAPVWTRWGFSPVTD